MRILKIIPGLIFGLAFAGGGIFIFSETALPTWKNWYAMQNWEPDYAQLVEVSGSENQTQAQYRYNYGGISYQGDRVYVAEFNDNIGSYHRGLLERLRQAFNTNQIVQIWINPVDPRQAVIDREMRWGLFLLMSGFCSFFVLIGLGLAYAILRSGKTSSSFRRPTLLALREEWKQLSQSPDFDQNFIGFCQSRFAELSQQAQEKDVNIDWQSRKGWASSTIDSEAGKGALKFWGFAIFWNAVSTPVLFVLPDELGNDNFTSLLVLIFPAVGVYLVYKAIQSSLEYKQFGRVVMIMDPYPGSIGGHVGGKIQVSRLDHKLVLDSAADLNLRLECVYSYVSGSGKNRSRREDIKWAEQGAPRVIRAVQGVEFRFRFDVPKNLPEADVEQSGAYYFWRLSVSASIKGIDLNRQYNLPVFKTGQASRFIRHNVSAQVRQQRERESEAVKTSIAQGNFEIPGLTRAMRVEDHGGEISLSFPMFRNKALTTFAAIFAGAFGFASYSMISMAFKGGGFGIFLALFCIPFLLVAIIAAIAMIYLAFNNLSVLIKSDRVSVTRRLLFLPIFSRLLKPDEITRLSIKRSGSTGQGVDKIHHFKLLAHERGGKTVTLAEDLDGEDVAAHFRDFIAHRLNLDTDNVTTTR